MMLQVKEHVERDGAAQPPADRAGRQVRPAAIVVHRPDRKKGGQGLPRRHRQQVIEQRRRRNDGEHKRQHREVAAEFGMYPTALARASGSERRAVQPHRE